MGKPQIFAWLSPHWWKVIWGEKTDILFCLNSNQRRNENEFMSLEQKFQVNLGGVIRLLSDHLYSGPEVYVRELLQNGVDAITARQQVNPSHEGMIRVEIIGDANQPTIMVEDNGVGLTEEEVHQFLATIGQSSKSGEFSRDDFIGQFGIGLLSGFVVSDEVTVITKSIKDGAWPVEWKGRADGTYSVRKLDSEFSVGTRVYLRAKSGKEDFFEPERVMGLLRNFGHHLPHSIVMDHGDESTKINEVAPWQLKHANEAERLEACLQYGRDVFGIEFLDAIPIGSKSGGVSGVAFVLPFAASVSAKQSHRVYLKNMLLAESVQGLLPDWAFFVRCVVNSNQLRPNAARDAFYEDDDLRAARKELGQTLRNYLVGLAEYDRARLDHLIDLHYMPIKALAIEDDEFLRLFADWLPFRTTLGTIRLSEYCKSNSTIRYVRTVDQFRQISSVATAQNICVFNGGYAYDAEILERVASEFPNRKVECIDSSDLVQNFRELTLDESQSVFDLIKIADVVLQKYKCSAEARKFEPTDLPTIYTANESASFLRSVDQSKEEADELWGGILDNVAQGAGRSAYAQLVLNFDNPLIPKLAAVKDRELLSRIIEILYLQSLLLGHYPLAKEERSILGNGLVDLIDMFLKTDG